ncbi:unnamed protein product [Malus baccata var. baccata]
MNAGETAEARTLFEAMPERNVITWNTMVMGYLNNQLYTKAIDLFYRMKAGDIKPDYLTLTGTLSACSHLGSLETGDLEAGEKAMELVVKRDWCLSDGEYMMFSNLYASCGQWEEAERWRNMMNDSGIVKTAGCSEIQVNGRFHKFLAGELGVE